MPRECTGNFFIDDEVLTRAGVTDFEKYSVVPGSRSSCCPICSSERAGLLLATRGRDAACTGPLSRRRSHKRGRCTLFLLTARGREAEGLR